MDEAQQEFRATETAVTPKLAQQDRLVEASPFEGLTEARLAPVEMAAERVGESVPAEPLRMAQMTERAEPLQMAQMTERVPAEPLQMTERAEPLRMAQMTERVPAEPLQQARLGESVPAEPLQPVQEALTPLHMGEKRMVDGTAMPTALTARTATMPLQPTTAATAQQKVRADAVGGSASQGFKVDPEQYRAAVGPVLAASDQIQQLYTNLSAFLSGMEATAPWGNDESGKHFAEGDKGYVKYSAETLKGLKGLPGAVQYVAEGLKTMADGYESADGNVTSDLDRQDGQLGATPPPTWSPAVHTPISPSITIGHQNPTGRH